MNTQEIFDYVNKHGGIALDHGELVLDGFAVGVLPNEARWTIRESLWTSHVLGITLDAMQAFIGPSRPYCLGIEAIESGELYALEPVLVFRDRHMAVFFGNKLMQDYIFDFSTMERIDLPFSSGGHEK